jgi:hypothetical protein
MTNPFQSLYNFYMGIPPQIRIPTQDGVLSVIFGIQTALPVMVGVGFALGLCGTPEATIHFLEQNAWAGFLGVAFSVGPYARVFQAKRQVANTVQLPSGAVATLIKQPTDGTVYPPITATPPGATP